jgi:hypothetical protein
LTLRPLQNAVFGSGQEIKVMFCYRGDLIQ